MLWKNKKIRKRQSKAVRDFGNILFILKFRLINFNKINKFCFSRIEFNFIIVAQIWLFVIQILIPFY